MKHDEYVKRLEEILLGMEWCHAVKTAHLKEAITAIQQLNNEAIGGNSDDNNGWHTTNREQNQLRQELRAVIGASNE